MEDVDDPEDKLPPVGNGTYQVKMRLKRDMPNWVPMYGRKVCFSYRGIKKQCNSCYGPHLRKYCKNEKMSLEEYADKSRPRNKYVPEQLYGKLAKLENIAEQHRKLTENVQNSQKQSSGLVSGVSHGPPGAPPARNQTTRSLTEKQAEVTPERVTVTLRRKEGDVWSTKQRKETQPDSAPNPKPDTAPYPGAVLKTSNLPTGSVAENVSSFLSGIRASFRSENVNVMPVPKTKKSSEVIHSEKV